VFSNTSVFIVHTTKKQIDPLGKAKLLLGQKCLGLEGQNGFKNKMWNSPKYTARPGALRVPR